MFVEAHHIANGRSQRSAQRYDYSLANTVKILLGEPTPYSSIASLSWFNGKRLMTPHFKRAIPSKLFWSPDYIQTGDRWHPSAAVASE
ncbi:hypothetical protein ALO45_200085 [Pseudomonas syringae pv. syringae]|nr:hypothetical protein ALO45_200085 [Pseudomonas syringae pv. syringae]